METTDQYIDIEVKGPNIEPSTLSVRDLADLVVAIETAVNSVARQRFTELSKESIQLSLTSIKKGNSADIRLQPSLRNEQFKALSLFSEGVAQDSFYNLPAKSYESALQIVKICKRINAFVEIKSNWTKDPSLVTFSPHTSLTKPERPYVEGETVLFGKILRAGGVKPTLVLKSAESTITVRTNEDTAKEVARHLYTNVGIKGVGKWDAESNELIDFRAISIDPYEGGSVVDAINEASEIAGKYFEDIDNVVDYISRLRKE